MPILTAREEFIILVDGDKLKSSDAIVVLEGDGFNRIEKAIELYRNRWADRIVLSGGFENRPGGSYHVKELVPVCLQAGISRNSIIVEDISLNTREQAVEVAGIISQNQWRRIILVASHYHQYRAYLTFLKVILENNLKTEIINAPADNLNWFEDPGWGKRFALLKDEFEKIEKYGKMGHIASFKQALKYQEWKEKQI
jgi:uncharacterized SAM-binding protein YcdF (DUF218 family)